MQRLLATSSVVDADNCVQLGNTLVTEVKTAGTLVAAGLESIGTNSTLNIASQNNTNTVNIGTGTGVQTINVGNNGAGATTINLGGGSDVVNISGLKLPTTGGTAATLSHYEEADFSSTFSGAYSLAAMQMSISRVGKVVTLSMKSQSWANATVAAPLTADTAIPLQFRPSYVVNSAIHIYDQSFAPSLGSLSVSTAGIIKVNPPRGSYTINSDPNSPAGFLSFSISYVM